MSDETKKTAMTRRELAEEARKLTDNRVTMADAENVTNYVIFRIADALRAGRDVQFRGDFAITARKRRVPIFLGASETKEVVRLNIRLSDK